MAAPVYFPAGEGKGGAEVGTVEWADRVRLRSHSVVKRASEAPVEFRSFVEFMSLHRAWTLMNKPDGSFFQTLEEFAEHPIPHGWGMRWATLRPILEAAAVAAGLDGKATMALAEVPEPKPAGRPVKGESNPGPLGPEYEARDGATKRVARIARDASGDVKDLFRAGLISDRDAAALSPAKKTPEQAVAIHAAEEAAKAVVRERGAPKDDREKRETKRAVGVAVKSALGKPLKPTHTLATITTIFRAWWATASANDRDVFLVEVQAAHRSTR